MDQLLPQAKVLIIVKTYPLPSRRYDELVCTAGLLDGTTWVRIYPVAFRSMGVDERFKKWEWIQLDLEKRPGNKDFRVESYQPRLGINEPISIVGGIDSKAKNAWALKKEYLLKNVQWSLEPLIEGAHNDKTSLGVIKPNVLEVIASKEPEQLSAQSKQGLLDLLPPEERHGSFKPVQTLPYRFYYAFTTESGKKHTLMVEDWEVGVLYWNALNPRGQPPRTPEQAKDLVIERLEDYGKNRDMHFIVGTTKEHHYAASPFVIIGLFYPPIEQTFGQADFGF